MSSKGVKYILDNLENFITARSLAYWVMDDGYKTTSGFYLCTESYTLEDNQKLSKILKNTLIQIVVFINILMAIDYIFLLLKTDY